MQQTEPGFYWYFVETEKPAIVRVTRDNRPSGRLWVWWFGCELEEAPDGIPGTFLGPLVPPERPKT